MFLEGIWKQVSEGVLSLPVCLNSFTIQTLSFEPCGRGSTSRNFTWSRDLAISNHDFTWFRFPWNMQTLMKAICIVFESWLLHQIWISVPAAWWCKLWDAAWVIHENNMFSKNTLEHFLSSFKPLSTYLTLLRHLQPRQHVLFLLTSWRMHLLAAHLAMY